MGSPAALFVYGTLLFPEVLEVVTARRFPARPAALRGYARWRLAGRAYPGLVEAGGAVTEGLLYTGLDADALAAVDRFEDDLYERRLVDVVLLSPRGRDAAGAPASGGAPAPGLPAATAFAYVLAAAHRHLLLPEPWDPQAFARELPAWLAACRRHPAGPAPTD